MGWGLKIGLFLFAIVAATFGSWIIAIPVLAYLFLPPLLTRKNGAPSSPGKDTSAATVRRGRVSVGRIAGAVLLLLGLVAVLAGGTASPLVFAIAGLLVLLGPSLFPRLSTQVRPVEDSVLLRGSVLLQRWYAMAEAKVSTRDPEGALSGVEEELLMVSTPSLRVIVVFAATSLGRKGAEEMLFMRMRLAARSLGSLGVYLLPLDSGEAYELAGATSRQIRAQEGELRRFLSSGNHGALSVESEHGFVTRFDAYETNAENGSGTLHSVPSQKPCELVTLQEFLRAAWQRTGAPRPDRYATFLSSMNATVGETLGQRVVETTQGQDGRCVLVAPVGGPQVELSRAQLQAVLRVYE